MLSKHVSVKKNNLTHIFSIKKCDKILFVRNLCQLKREARKIQWIEKNQSLIMMLFFLTGSLACGFNT